MWTCHLYFVLCKESGKKIKIYISKKWEENVGGYGSMLQTWCDGAGVKAEHRVHNARITP